MFCQDCCASRLRCDEWWKMISLPRKLRFDFGPKQFLLPNASVVLSSACGSGFLLFFVVFRKQKCQRRRGLFMTFNVALFEHSRMLWAVFTALTSFFSFVHVMSSFWFWLGVVAVVSFPFIFFPLYSCSFFFFRFVDFLSFFRFWFSLSFPFSFSVLSLWSASSTFSPRNCKHHPCLAKLRLRLD